MVRVLLKELRKARVESEMLCGASDIHMRLVGRVPRGGFPLAYTHGPSCGQLPIFS